MSRSIEKYLVREDGARRLALFRRDDGTFGYLEEYFYSSWDDGKLTAEGWATLSPSATWCGSLSSVETEARGFYSDWVFRDSSPTGE